MIAPMSRRFFLASSASAVAALGVSSSAASPAPVDTGPEPTGSVYGRTGARGIPPGTPASPSKGRVTLLDGRVLEASHVHSRGIGAGKSVFLAPDGQGGWSILYAEC